jgi:hypothetical protein
MFLHYHLVSMQLERQGDIPREWRDKARRCLLFPGSHLDVANRLIVVPSSQQNFSDKFTPSSVP